MDVNKTNNKHQIVQNRQYLFTYKDNKRL